MRYVSPPNDLSPARSISTVRDVPVDSYMLVGLPLILNAANRPLGDTDMCAMRMWLELLAPAPVPGSGDWQ